MEAFFSVSCHHPLPWTTKYHAKKKYHMKHKTPEQFYWTKLTPYKYYFPIGCKHRLSVYNEWRKFILTIFTEGTSQSRGAITIWLWLEIHTCGSILTCCVWTVGDWKITRNTDTAGQTLLGTIPYTIIVCFLSLFWKYFSKLPHSHVTYFIRNLLKWYAFHNLQHHSTFVTSYMSHTKYKICLHEGMKTQDGTQEAKHTNFDHNVALWIPQCTCSAFGFHQCQHRIRHSYNNPGNSSLHNQHLKIFIISL